MQQIRLAPNVLLLITDNITSVDLNSTSLYLYDYATRKQLIFEDGETEERTNQFAHVPNNYASYDKVLLSTTPNFYPDTHFSANFHTNSELSNVLVNTPSSQLNFVECKLMFTSGFGYDVDNIALQTLNIKYEGQGYITDLIALYDDYSASKVTASPSPKILDGVVFNSEISFRLLDVASLFSMSSLDAVELRGLLFGTQTPSNLLVEYGTLDVNGVQTFTESSLSFTKIITEVTNTATLKTTMEDSEITLDLSFSNNELTMQLEHTRFNLEAYLTQQGITVDAIEYDLTLHQYDVSNNSLGFTTTRLSNTVNAFGAIVVRVPSINDDTDYINVELSARLKTSDGATINKLASLVIADVSNLHGVDFDISFEDYTLKQEVTQNITQITSNFDAPTIVEVDKLVYVQSFGVGEITLYPVSQVIEINGVYSTQLEKSVEFNRNFTSNKQQSTPTDTVSNPTTQAIPSTTILQIGERQYSNMVGNPLRYKIDEYAHAEGATDYLLLDEDGLLIASGKVVNI